MIFSLELWYFVAHYATPYFQRPINLTLSTRHQPSCDIFALLKCSLTQYRVIIFSVSFEKPTQLR